MCDVHLAETRRVLGPAGAGLRCCYCGDPIQGEALHVEGRLDDGSPGLYRFAYHPDCAWDMEHDEEVIEARAGCFDYGAPISIVDAAEGAGAQGAGGWRASRTGRLANPRAGQPGNSNAATSASVIATFSARGTSKVSCSVFIAWNRRCIARPSCSGARIR